MKALMLTEYLKLEYKNVPEPQIGPGEVLLRIKAGAICGSDIQGYDGSTGRRVPPIIMGHEASGVIEAIGSEVNRFAAGDRVTFDSTVYCRNCHPCSIGKINLCDNRRIFGVSCDDYSKDGAFAEYLAVPEYILYRLPDSVTYEEASVIEPLAIALHAVNRTGIRTGDDVLVVGCGTIGQLTIKLISIMGCGSITAVDIDSEKLKMSLKNGADNIINSKEENVNSRILELTGGKGVDSAFEAVGISDTVGYTIKSLKKGGEVTLVGNIQKNIDFPLQHAVTNEISINTSCASAGEYATCLKLISSGKIELKDIIGLTAPLSEGAGVFDKLRKDSGIIKAILLP